MLTSVVGVWSLLPSPGPAQQLSQQPAGDLYTLMPSLLLHWVARLSKDQPSTLPDSDLLASIGRAAASSSFSLQIWAEVHEDQKQQQQQWRQLGEGPNLLPDIQQDIQMPPELVAELLPQLLQLMQQHASNLCSTALEPEDHSGRSNSVTMQLVHCLTR